MIKRCGVILLVFLQVLLLVLPPDVAAYLGSSQNYKVVSDVTGGGTARSSSAYKVSQDMLNALVGRFQSQNYRVASGLVHAVTIYNRPPVLDYIGNKSTDENQLLEFTVKASDPDGNALSFSASNLPQGATLTDNKDNTAKFSWTPTYEQSGNYADVRFEVSDGKEADWEKITITVGNTNRPPELAQIGNKSVDENALLEFTVTAADPDNDQLTFKASNLPSGATFTDNGDKTAKFSWTPTYDQSGSYPSIKIEASDGKLTDDETIDITVTNVNRPPRLKNPDNPIPDIEVNEGDTAVIDPATYYEDPDGQTLFFYFESPFDTQGKWITTYDDAGVKTITVTVSDSVTTVEEEVQVTVKNVNRRPTAELTLSKYTVNKNETFNIRLVASDPDKDSMTYTIEKDGTQIASGSITAENKVDTSIGEAGDHTIRATVTDADGLSALDGGLLTKTLDVIDPNQSRYDFYPVMGDFNGDGVTDLGLHNNKTGTWEISLSDHGVFTSAPDWLTGFGDSKDWLTLGGDFNGDGLSDAAVYNNTTGVCKVAFSNGSSFSIQGTWLTFGSASYDWQPLTGDFNGDGKTDFSVYNKKNGTLKVAISTGAAFGDLTDWITSFGGSDESALTGDFNGDGLADIAIYNESSGNWRVAFNTGSQLADQGTWITGYAANKKILLADFNSDGFVDIGWFDKDAGKWFYAISNGASFIDKGEYYAGFGSSAADSGQTGDFNGDGITDLATFDQDKDGMDRWLTRLIAYKPSDLLVKADNGVGGITTVTYDYAAKQDNDLLPFPVYVATSVKITDYKPAAESPQDYINNFLYKGGYYSTRDREFRGFRVARSTDPITGNYTETYFHQGKDGEEGALKGQIDRIIAVDGNGKTISEMINTYDVRKGGPLDSSLGFPYIKEAHSKVYEENLTFVETKDGFEYNNIGNVTQTINEGDLSTLNDNKITRTTYDLAYTNFNRALQSQLLDKDENVLSQKNFKYDDRGNLVEQRDCLNFGDDPITTFAYDAYGSVISTTNANNHTVSTVYENTFNQFPETITNVLNHTIHYVYEPKFGVVRSIRDANGNITKTEYDALGRITKEINTYDEVVTTYAYPDFNTKVTSQLNHVKTEYLDGLARNYMTVTIGEAGNAAKEVVTERFYNNRGLLEEETLPHYIDALQNDIAHIRYIYDIRGRITHTMADFPGTEKDAITITRYLTPLSTKIIDPKDHAKTIIKDVNNNVIEVIEHTSGGDFHTYYEYDLKSNLVRVTDAQGNRVQVFYDSLGRKTSMIDPDTGTTRYTYDAMGNILTQIDNKGQKISFVYDDINRLIRKDYASPTMADIIYAYDALAPPNSIGRLSEVSDGASKTSYEYDKEGRVVKTTKVIDGSAYITLTSYDILGRITSLTYPDGEVVNYTYDVNSGLLEKVEGSQVYIQDITYNAAGQILLIKYGNNTQTDYSYGQDQRLQRILTTNNPRLTTLQDLNYDFDKAGNLLTLTDNLIPDHKTRSYQYDDLNRLTRAENIPDPVGGYSTYTYQYDAIGNMIYKSDLGAFVYGEGGAGPHAVTTAGGYSYTYDKNGNMIKDGRRGKDLYYDDENRLFKVSNAGQITQFTYDSNGNRVKKASSSQTVLYAGNLYEVISDSVGVTKMVKHIFTGSDRSITVEIDAQTLERRTSYYHTDHLGSSNIITNQNGDLQTHFEYTPYGTTSRDERPINPNSRTTDYRFTGKELDSTGLYYYGARYYDPELGRFITADSFVQDPLDPQTLNRYTYCRNNPLIYTDPTGHFFGFIIAVIVSAIIGAVVGAAVGAGMAAIMGGDIGRGALWGAIGGALTGGISTALGAVATVGIGGSFSASIGALGTLSVPMQASIVGVAAFSTSLIVGAMQGVHGSALWRSAGISAGIAFASTMVIGSISEAMKNQRANNQQINNNLGPDINQTTSGDLQTSIDEKVYKLTLSVKRGGGSSGMGYKGNEWGHAWVTLEDPSGTQITHGFWPGEGAGKEAILGKQYSGVVTTTTGMLDEGISQADISFTWNLSAKEFISATNYVKDFNSNWSLSVNCTNFAVGTARAAGINMPSDFKTLFFADPNRLADWLESLAAQ